MLRNLSQGEPTCLTVTHLDSLVLARCGFNHSADYRSVMAFGHAPFLDEEEKRRALVMMVDRFFPGRTAQLRATAPQEVNLRNIRRLDGYRALRQDSRAKGVADDDEDYLLPVYAERLPVRMVIGVPEACPRLAPGVDRPTNLSGYREGRPLEEAVTEAHTIAYGS